MDVLYVLGQDAGGLPHYTAELANAVSEHADVTVIKPRETTADDLFDDEVDLVEAFRSLSVSMPEIYKRNVSPVEFARGFCSYNSLKQVQELDADITHVTTGLFPQTKLFSWLHRIDDVRPFVVTYHEIPVDLRSLLRRPPVFAEELVNSAIPDLDEDGIIVHTDKQREAMEEHGTAGDVIEVIPHGTYSVFGSHEDVSIEPERNTLLFFGNIVPPKGLDVLVEAIPRVKRAIPDVKLIIAGDGKLSKRTKRIVEAHPENFEVHNYFVPNEEVKQLFARAEAVVLPYRDQHGLKGHSGALSTAFSFGKPVVSSTAGEFRELVERSGAGITVSPEESDELASAIRQVLSDPDARARMSENSLQMAEKLSWENIARRHLDLYERIDERRATPPITGQ